MSGPIASTERALTCEFFVPQTLAGEPCSSGLPRAVRDDPGPRARIPFLPRPPRRCSVGNARFQGKGRTDLPPGSRRVCPLRAHLAMLQHLSWGGRAEEEEGVSRLVKRGDRGPRWVIPERCYPARRPGRPGPPAASPPHRFLPGAHAPSFRLLFFCDEFYFFSTASDS